MVQHGATSDPILAPAQSLILAAEAMRAGALASLDFSPQRIVRHGCAQARVRAPPPPSSRDQESTFCNVFMFSLHFVLSGQKTFERIFPYCRNGLRLFCCLFSKNLEKKC